MRQAVDTVANLTSVQVFQPFGKLLAVAGTGMARFRFAGEVQDATDLFYLRSRYYHPGVGVFTTRDLWYGDPREPRTLHLYSYVGANPVSRTDPSGLCWDWDPEEGMIQRTPFLPADGPCPGSSIEGPGGTIAFDRLVELELPRIGSQYQSGLQVCSASNSIGPFLVADDRPLYLLLRYDKGADPVAYTKTSPIGTGNILEALPEVLPVQPTGGVQLIYRTDYYASGPVSSEDIAASGGGSIGEPGARLGVKATRSLETGRTSYSAYLEIAIFGLRLGRAAGRNEAGLYASGAGMSAELGLVFDVPDYRLVYTSDEFVMQTGGYQVLAEQYLPEDFGFTGVVYQSYSPAVMTSWLIENHIFPIILP